MPYYKNTRIKYAEYIRNLGLFGFLRYWLKRRSQKRLTAGYQLRSPRAKFPLFCRPRSSDIAVFKQIYAQREYSCIDDLPTTGPGLIIDCGANAGFSTTYLLNRFPECTVLAVEPDPGNVAALQQNVLPYGSRVRCIEAAVWSHATRLDLSTSAGDGLEWARTVSPAVDEADGKVRAVDLSELISSSGHQRVRLLKIDIEGAETTVFGDTSAAWLPLVDAIVIELHGTECEEIFKKAVLAQGFKLRNHMELTIAQR